VSLCFNPFQYNLPYGDIQGAGSDGNANNAILIFQKYFCADRQFADGGKNIVFGNASLRV
jgi:hypothetical protein